MSDNRPISNTLESAEYHSLAAAINYTYCKKHGYDFQYYRPYLEDKSVISLYNCVHPRTNSPRHASWSKLLTTLLVLQQNYDYVVYIDSDCIFKDFTQTLESYITRESERDCIFFTNRPFNIDKPCAGFYCCKVTPVAKHLFVLWYSISNPATDKSHAWEQDTLWVLTKHFNMGLIDSPWFEEAEGQFLRHISSLEKEKRVPYFREVLRTNGIDFAAAIGEIECFEYNTYKAFLENKG